MNDIMWSPKNPEKSRMWQFIKFTEKKYKLRFANYENFYNWSIAELAKFWQTLSEFFNINFDQPATQILSTYKFMFEAKWFINAKFNYAKVLLEGMRQKSLNHSVLISIQEDGTRNTFNSEELYSKVAQCVQGLKVLNIQASDRIMAIMPNIPQTIIAMLACAAIGAIWSSCSLDFGAEALIDRLNQINPKIIFIADGYKYANKTYPSLEKIKNIANTTHSLSQIIIYPHLNINYQKSLHDLAIPIISWDEFLQPQTNCTFISLPFNHPLYIVFSSGTTGKPKCIVHGAGGTLLQHLKDLGLHTDINLQDNFCFYTTTGWMMWNWMISALALGATLILYEGSPTYPNPERLLQLIDEENISIFGTSAKLISIFEKNQINIKNKFSLVNLRTILSTGSPLLSNNYEFIYQYIKKDVILSSISGGTDILSCFALGNPLLPVRKNEITSRGLGMAVEIFDDQGNSIIGKRGELVCTKPFPCMPLFFWNEKDNNRYYQTYFSKFPNIWTHGDFAELTYYNGLIIYGRSDTILNPGGVRIGTAEIYRQLEIIPEIEDAVVISQNWQDDVRIVLFVKLKPLLVVDELLKSKIITTIRANTSPRHVPKKILQVNDIPKTLNGKIVELAVKQVVHGEKISNLQALANPDSLIEFQNRVELLD